MKRILNYIDNLNRNKTLWWIVGLSLLLVYYLPYIILGEDAAIRVFDNLDGEVIYKMFTARKGFWLDYKAVIPEIMDGLPRFCITSGLNFTTLMYGLFSPFWAYLVNDFVMRCIGFIGMYLLMKRYVLQSNQRELEATLIVSGYILISYFTIYGLTDLGQPLVLYAFLNILKQRQSVTDYLCVLFFPFFSSFVLSGFFVGVALATIGIGYMCWKRQYHKTIFWTLIGYGFCCLVVEYNLILPILTGFHSHREEIVFTLSGSTFVSFFLGQLWETYIHPGQFFTLPIWVIVLISVCTAGSKRRIVLKALGIFLLIYFVIIMIYYFNYSLKGFRFSRFYHLLPLCWFLLLGTAVCSVKYSCRVIVYLVLFLQITFLYVRHVNYVSGNRFRDAIGLRASYHYPSYKSFYAVSLFKKVADYIGRDLSEYRVVNVGILPAVAQYNVFYTLDSYQNNYPLEYKHRFRKIIECELDKMGKENNVFDGFGNWCYIFPAEINPMLIVEGKYNKKNVLNHLELNYDGLKGLQCDYVFSSAEIKNSEKSGLKLLHFFSDEEAHWDLWLYEVV